MSTVNIILILLLLVGCGVNRDYSGSSSTGVVITKNPKGQAGGSTETKQMELHAPWLSPSSELYLEIKSVNVVDAAGQRETIGITESGTYLLLTRKMTGKIEFHLSPEQLKNVKSIEIVVANVFAKNSGKSLAPFGKLTTLSLPVASASPQAEAAPYAAFISVGYARSGSCSLGGQLTSSVVQSGVSEKCGGEVKSDDSDEDEGDDDKGGKGGRGNRQ